MNLSDYNYASAIVNYYSIDAKRSHKKLKELDSHLRIVFSNVIACKPISTSDKAKLNHQLLAIERSNYKFHKKSCIQKSEASANNILGNRISSKSLLKQINQFSTFRTTRFARLPKELINIILSKQTTQELSRSLEINRMFSPVLSEIAYGGCLNSVAENKISINYILNLNLQEEEFNTFIHLTTYFELVDDLLIPDKKRLVKIFGDAANAQSISIKPEALPHFKYKEKITSIKLNIGIVDESTIEELRSYTTLKSLHLYLCKITPSAVDALNQPLPFEYKSEYCIF